MAQTFAQYKESIELSQRRTFGNIMERAKRLYPNADEYNLNYYAKSILREQILHIIGSHYGYSKNDQYRMLKQYFQQKIGDEYVTLPINRRGQANLQKSKALQRLLNEKYIKLKRENIGFSKGRGYFVKQSYLVLNEDNLS